MFDKEVNIIFISRDQIRGAVVLLDNIPRIKKEVNTAWTDQDLDKSLVKILTQFPSRKIRLLLGKDLSYVLKFSIPASDKGSKERDVVYELVKDQIPEELESEDWDYKVIERDDKEKQIIAFSPVKEVFLKISTILNDQKYLIEAVEPEEVAISRNADPIIGIALKKDIKGKDDDSLNMELAVEEIVLPETLVNNNYDTSPPSTSPSKFRLNRSFVVISITVMILGVITAGGIIVSRRSAVEAPVANEVSTPQEIVTPTLPPEISLSSYSVMVLNGSGISGQAGSLANTLKVGGFDKIETGNSDSFEYEGITVRIKEEINSDLLRDKIRQILADTKMNIIFENNQPVDQQTDLILIIGK